MEQPAAWWRSIGDETGPRNPLLVVVTGDDAGAQSRLQPDYSQHWEQATRQGATATSRVASFLDVPIHVTDTPDLPPGHDLLLLAGVGRGLTTAVAEVACARLGTEAQLAVGYGSGISDNEWMRKVTDVRQRASAESSVVPGPIATMAELLSQARARDLPVLLDGAAGVAAAYVCTDRPDMHLPVVGDEPAQRWFTDHMEVPVWGVTGLPPKEGLGALAGLAWLRLALLASDV